MVSIKILHWFDVFHFHVIGRAFIEFDIIEPDLNFNATNKKLINLTKQDKVTIIRSYGGQKVVNVLTYYPDI